MVAIGRGDFIMTDKYVWLFEVGKNGEKYIEEYHGYSCRGFVDNSHEK